MADNSWHARHISLVRTHALYLQASMLTNILTRHGLNRWRDLEPAEPVRRYERGKPGEMIHIDIKNLSYFNQLDHRITGERAKQSRRRGKKGGKTWF